jgi:hypothetical protein
MVAREPSEESIAAMLAAADRPPPTPTLATPFSRILKIGEISAADAASLGLGALKTLPASLNPDAAPLAPEVVERIWTEWIANSRILILDKGYSLFEEYCRDGTRTILAPSSESDSPAPTYRWGIAVNPGGRWNVAALIYDVDNPFVPDYLASPTKTLLDPSHVSEGGNLLQSSDDVELLIYESEGCAQ